MKKIGVWLVVIAVLALGYVQQRITLVTMGYDVEKLRNHRDQLLDQNRVLQYNVLTLRSPVILERRLAQRDVQLAPPQHVEIVPRPRQLNLSARSADRESPGPTWLMRVVHLAASLIDMGRRAEAKPEL